MTWYFVSSLFMALSSAIGYLYFFKKGQFDKLEDVKYQLLRDDDDAEV